MNDKVIINISKTIVDDEGKIKGNGYSYQIIYCPRDPNKEGSFHEFCPVMQEIHSEEQILMKIQNSISAYKERGGD